MHVSAPLDAGAEVAPLQLPLDRPRLVLPARPRVAHEAVEHVVRDRRRGDHARAAASQRLLVKGVSAAAARPLDKAGQLPSGEVGAPPRLWVDLREQ